MTELLAYLSTHQTELLRRISEHLLLTGMATLTALLLGVGLAILAFRWPRLRGGVLGLTQVLQTIPGIALLVIMMALLGQLGTVPATAALILYALLPIVQNSLVGLTSLSPALAEAALGLGMNASQRLWWIRLPMAMPMMMAGLRTAAVQTVGLATLAAFVGAGGLGQFINRGLFLSDARLILLGAIPAALIALLIDRLILLLQTLLSPYTLPLVRQRARYVLGVLLVISAVLLGMLARGTAPSATAPLVIGSKNFTEQLLLGEIVAQQIEAHTPYTVERRFGLGGSTVLHRALRNGSVDMAVEYSGTGWMNVLKRPLPSDRAQLYPDLRQAYAEQFQLQWLPPLGFDNSYVLAVRHDDPRLDGIDTISKLAAVAPQLQAGFDFEFAGRSDGYVGLKHAYGLNFARVRDMHPDLMYSALLSGATDVIAAYATDGRLSHPNLRTLRDDRPFFPPYAAGLVVREQALAAYPALRPALEALSGTLTTEQMRRLNAAIDTRTLSLKDAASQALTTATH